MTDTTPMDAKTYSIKEIQIFDGVLDLLKEGHPLHTLKVADIAAAAGMGKSTAYEYFESKEAILKEALLYHVGKAQGMVTHIVEEAKTLEEVLSGIMEHIVSVIDSRLFTIIMMMMTLGTAELRPGSPLSLQMMEAQNRWMEDLLGKILKVGRTEGTMDETLTEEEVRLLLDGLFSAFTKEAAALRLGLPCMGAPWHRVDDVDEATEALKARTKKLIRKGLA